MQTPVEITFRNVDPSPSVEEAVRKRVAKLNQFCPEMISCRVVIDSPHKRQQRGNLYHVRIDMFLPGRELVVTHQQHDDETKEDIRAAVRKAFEQAQRRLKAFREKRDEIHPAADNVVPVYGRVARLSPEEGSGYLETIDGRDVYFSREDVLDGKFEQMKVGSEVRFAEHLEGKAPRASTILLVEEQPLVGNG